MKLKKEQEHIWVMQTNNVFEEIKKNIMEI